MGNINCNGEILIYGENILSKVHPVDSIYMSTSPTSPASLFGGEWEMLPEGYALWTASSNAGETISAGLPEISGNVSSVWCCTTFDNSPQSSGATWLGGRVTNGSAAGGGWQMYLHNLNFNASRSNSIYGKSSTVQPPAIKVYAWKRVA